MKGDIVVTYTLELDEHEAKIIKDFLDKFGDKPEIPDSVKEFLVLLRDLLQEA